jgi:C4-dicarboxylate-specific signal transduction histidine kinase
MTGEKLILQSRINETGLIEVSVIDSGPGVTETTAKRLITPFMTTKKVAPDWASQSATIVEAWW